MRKGGYFMAVKVRERPKGSGIYWIFIDHQGKRKSKKVGNDKRLAQQAAKKIEARLTLGDLGLLINEENNARTFRDYARTWLEVTVPATCKPSTARDYKHFLLNHVMPKLGNILVSDINRLQIKTLLMEKAKSGLSMSSINQIKSVVSGVLNLAVDDEILSSNPAHRLGKVVKTKNIRDGIDPLSRDELSLLLRTFREEFPKDYPLALTLARTGMRYGEALALQWGDIDFHNRLIRIQRNFTKGNILTPKSGKSRSVDMSKQLKSALFEMRHRRKLETVRKGWGKVPEWVFVNKTGNPLDGNNWRRRVFYRCLSKAGIRKTRIHDLRHTYASLLIQAGESLAYVRDQLGHHSIRVTVDIYGHFTPGGNKDAVDRLDDNFDATIRNLYATKTKKEDSSSG
jgi:integrase